MWAGPTINVAAQPEQQSPTGAGLGAAAILALALSALRAERNYQALPSLPEERPEGPLPALSVIVPARNEAANLPDLLSSLAQTKYPGTMEIIVVDDASQDGTAEIARHFPVRLVRNERLPDGWTGKTYACHRGAQEARGDWLLFVDADTRHDAQGPARAVAYALRHDLDGLSLFLPNASSGAADRLALMVAFASFFAASDLGSGVLNGQYILLRRQAYWGCGGFARVRRQVTEDLALGKHLQESGYRVPILRGNGAGRVHMYPSAVPLWQGLSRYTIASLRWTGLRGVWAVLLTVSAAAPLEFVMSALRRGAGWRRAIVSWATAAAAMSGWAARFGGPGWALLAPIGAMQVQVTALWGIVRRLCGRGVRWKGRDL